MTNTPGTWVIRADKAPDGTPRTEVCICQLNEHLGATVIVCGLDPEVARAMIEHHNETHDDLTQKLDTLYLFMKTLHANLALFNALRK
jgi:hypothetical protein